MFKLLPIEVSADIIERSTLFNKEEIIGLMPLLKETLIEVKEKRERPPFLKRILDILPTANPDIEKKLYGTLLKHLPVEDICDSVISIYPAELISQLPDNIYKEVVSQMAIETQVQYFVSLGDDRSEQINRVASKGSKNREMIEFEINSILKNDLLTQKIMTEKKSDINQEFLNLTRAYIVQHPDSQKEVFPIMKKWLEGIKRDVSTQVFMGLAA
jgi:hypothetical protein